MLKKFLFEEYPQPNEYEIPNVKLTLEMIPEVHEHLKRELGTMMFGNQYDSATHENAHMTARMAGHLGAQVQHLKQFRFDMTPRSFEELEKTIVQKGLL